MKAYRVFYRPRTWQHPQEVVWGEEALAHVLGRKRPTVVHHELAALWKCDVCRKRGPWEAGWRMIPAKQSGQRADFSNQAVVCGRECAEVHAPGYVKPHWLDDGLEPIPRDPKPRGWTKRLQARWDAFGDERDRKAKSRDHRKLPMLHEGKGEGWCRWCGKEVQRPQRTWHKDCKRTWLLHYDAYVQTRFLRERDGGICKAEGCDQGGYEVDHIKPLWSVRDLPDEERLPFFGPDNLQLLCGEHHKEKTSREAGERARLKRGD